MTVTVALASLVYVEKLMTVNNDKAMSTTVYACMQLVVPRLDHGQAVHGLLPASLLEV